MKEASELLGNFFDKSFYQEGEKYLEFKSAWSNIIGSDLSAHIDIYDLKDNILVAHADHPGWAQMFQMKKTAILKKIQKKFPELTVKDIKVKFKDNEFEKKAVKIEETIPKKMNLELSKAVDDKDFSNLLEKFKKRSES